MKKLVGVLYQLNRKENYIKSQLKLLKIVVSDFDLNLNTILQGGKE